MTKLGSDFFNRDVLEVAPALLGKKIVHFSNGKLNYYSITETEAYCGEEDKACHASKGRTPRNEIMYSGGGCIYVYLIYGMYWMLNFVTGSFEEPQAVLIRGVEGFQGPGKLTKHLGINASYKGEDLSTSSRIWVECHGVEPQIKAGPRVGIEYAGEPWKSIKWRFFV